MRVSAHTHAPARVHTPGERRQQTYHQHLCKALVLMSHQVENASQGKGKLINVILLKITLLTAKDIISFPPPSFPFSTPFWTYHVAGPGRCEQEQRYPMTQRSWGLGQVLELQEASSRVVTPSQTTGMVGQKRRECTTFPQSHNSASHLPKMVEISKFKFN